ncbi:DUF3147 family protein [Formicincola oecophyllae]|uniref:DUF3147 family protein n=1 Tax=Formicincola oecophyllae TaxID=2558361 RepID=A0A4Y6UE33_9PROT|nr:DUF3147 family protein [Formicincola oecophyllae]QDH14275.1 DUF3147 family protein [Formicincola oecophyllae]
MAALASPAGLFTIKAAFSGLLIAGAATVAQRWPGLGALVVSLPLLSIMTMVWLWCEKPDRALMSAHSTATFWYVLPSLPMFLLLPWLLGHGWSFWLALAVGCALTFTLYSLTVVVGRHWGLPL